MMVSVFCPKKYKYFRSANLMKMMKCNLFIFKQMNDNVLKSSGYYTSPRLTSKYIFCVLSTEPSYRIRKIHAISSSYFPPNRFPGWSFLSTFLLILRTSRNTHFNFSGIISYIIKELKNHIDINERDSHCYQLRKENATCFLWFRDWIFQYRGDELQVSKGWNRFQAESVFKSLI